MSDQEKYNEQIIIELQELRKELEFLKISSDNELYIHKQNELEFRKNEERLKYALEVATDGLWDWDVLSNRVFYSTQWKAILGFGDSEIGDTLEEWSSRVHPDDLDRVLGTVDQYLKGEVDTYSFEHRLVCKDGSYKWINDQGKIVARDENGKALRLIGTHTDITQRKKTEFDLNERLKELNCHNRISEVLSESNLSENEVIEKILGVIPGSWQFPEMAQASVTIYDKVFKTPGYEQSDNKLAVPIIVNGAEIGQITVTYSSGFKSDVNQLFLPEESNLLFSVAERLGNFVENNQNILELRTNEEKYRNLIENINDVIYTTDIHANITFISPSITKLLGYLPEEIVGKNFIYFVGDKSEQLTKRFQEIQKKAVLQNEYQILSKTGEPHWIRFSSKGIFNELQFTGVTGMLTDITGTKLIELELQKSESLYRSILTASPDTIFIADLNGNVLFTSPMALKMFGYEETGFPINTPLFDFVDPKDHAKARVAIQQMFEGKYTGATEYIGIKSDGSKFDMEVNGEFIRDAEGKPTSLVFVTRDISDRKLASEKLGKSEEKYHNIFLNAQEGIFQTSIDGSYISLNPALAKMYGYDSPDELIKSRTNISNDSYSDASERKNFLNAMEKDGFVKGYEYEVKHKDGHKIWFYEDAKVIRDANGMVQYFEGFVVDITERILAERALKDKTSLLTNLILNLQEGILLEDLHRKILLTNQLFCNMFGIPAPPEALIGADCTDSAEQSKSLFKNPEKFIADIELILADKKAVFNNELELVDGRYLERDYIPTYVDLKYTGHLWKYRDITLRKQTEAALLASEIKFRNLVENINDVVYKVDNQGIIKYISPAIEKIIGYTADEITGKNFSHFVGENANELSQRLIALKYNKELEKEYKIITKYGVPCYIRLSTKAVFEDGNFKGGSGTLIDITDRKRAEEGLRKLYQAVEQSPAMTLITDLNGNIEYINAKMIALTGYSKEELIGKNPRLFSTSEKGKGDYIELWQTISSGSEWKGEFHNKKKNGDLYWVMASISPVVDSNGDISHYVSVEEDITERKVTEERIIQQNERLNAIISAIPDMIFVIDIEGTYTEFYCSEYLSLLIPDDQIIGKNLTDIFDSELANRHLQNIRNCIQQKKLITYEYEMSLDDSVRFFEARLAPLGLRKTLTFVREITERKKSENEIKDLNVNLEIKIVERTSELAITNSNLYREIEARNNVTAALEEALDRLHKIADQIPGVVFQFQLFADGTSCFPYASEGLWDIFRVRPEEVINDASIIFTRILPGYLDDIFASIQKSARDMQLWKYEFQVASDDGTVQWLYGKFSPQQESNGSVLWHGFITDITELKMAEDALRRSEIKHSSMISNISDVIGIMGTDGLMKYKSPNIVKDFGWHPEDLVGTDGWRTVHPDDIERIQKEFYAVIQEDNIAKTVEYRYLCKDGTYKPIELTAINLINDKVINGVLLNYHDITERKQAEEKINEARNIAEKANLAKSEFLSRMSHELRTPMNSILGFAQLLEMGELNKGQKKSVSHIFQSGKHLLNLINEVLDISRIESGHISILLESVNVIAVLNEMIDSVRQQAIEKQLKLELINMSNGKLYVNTDLQRIKQILLNLLGNAIKYNTTGGFVIIKTEMMPINTFGIVYLRIEITDSGPGISSDDITKLFTPFERIGAEKTETEGTGLGLAVVKKLMDALNGNVGVTSIPGEGSTFWLELPMIENLKTNKVLNEENQKQAAELIVANKELAFQNEEKSKRAKELVTANIELAYQNEEKSKRAEELVTANIELAFQNEEKSKRAKELVIANIELAYQNEEKAKRAKELNIANIKLASQNTERFKGEPLIEKTSTILYVEDNLSNAELVEEILNSHRPSIRLITSVYGNFAVKYATDYKPDLILLDLDLPDIHGSKVLTNLLKDERTKSIPVIIISADAMPNQIIHLLKSGAKDYITKPIDITLFLQVLDVWVPGKV